SHDRSIGGKSHAVLTAISSTPANFFAGCHVEEAFLHQQSFAVARKRHAAGRRGKRRLVQRSARGRIPETQTRKPPPRNQHFAIWRYDDATGDKPVAKAYGS